MSFITYLKRVDIFYITSLICNMCHPFHLIFQLGIFFHLLDRFISIFPHEERSLVHYQ